MMATEKNPRLRYTPHLHDVRRDAGVNMNELEAMSGVAQSTISYLENEKRGARHSTVAKLAAALDVKPSELTGNDEDDQPRRTRRGAGRTAAFSAPPGVLGRVSRAEPADTSEYDDMVAVARIIARDEGISVDDALMRLIRARPRKIDEDER